MDGEPRLRISLRTALILAIILVILSSTAAYGVFSYLHPFYFRELAVMRQFRESPHWEQFLRVLTIASTEYVDPEKAQLDNLLKGAMAGTVRALDDPYSAYFDLEHLKAFKIETSGLYQGIGVMVVEKTIDDVTYVTVVSPFEGTPAATTPFEGGGARDPRGVKPGDMILEVNGQAVTGLPIDTVAEMIRGPEGTAVTLKIRRAEHDEPLIFKITRTSITVPTTRRSMLDGGIGYLQITMFQENTAAQVKEDLDWLSAQGMKALVLDLRNNPGGLLEVSAEIAEIFVPRGPIVTVVDRSGDKETYTSKTGPFELPFVVLVNEGSASASEIVAGAIQDYQVAPLVGTTTFGKGSVQRMWSLDEEVGATDQGAAGGLKITVAKYLTPKGRSIHGKGLEPDLSVQVEGAYEPGNPTQDPQLARALEVLKKERAER